ncbi:MAG TPA: hypothetical protein VGC47_02320 [Acidimicrobiia bacterium]
MSGLVRFSTASVVRRGADLVAGDAPVVPSSGGAASAVDLGWAGVVSEIVGWCGHEFRDRVGVADHRYSLDSDAVAVARCE